MQNAECFGVALGAFLPSAFCLRSQVAWGSHEGGLRVARSSYVDGLQVAWGWLGVALRGLSPSLAPPSSFFILHSAFARVWLPHRLSRAPNRAS